MKKTMNWRWIFFSFIVILMSAVLAVRFFILQIRQGEDYQTAFEEQIRREQRRPGMRGLIYDRDGELLAYNELSYTITMSDNGYYNSRQERNDTLNQEIAQVIELVTTRGSQLESHLSIRLNENGQYDYTVDGSRRRRLLADVFGHSSTEDLAFNSNLGFDEGLASAEQLMEYLCSDEVYGIDKNWSRELQLQTASIRFALGNNSYQRYRTIEIANEVNEETVVAIMENQAELPGIEVAERSLRRYIDDASFSHILGYTGEISEEEMENWNSQGYSYYLGDIVGKSGIEQVMEQELRGADGQEVFYVDNVGRRVETLAQTDASVGNNVYLTIDADLQMAVYDLLEQKLAGILLANLVSGNSQEDDSLQITMEDICLALFDNHIIQEDEFTRPSAGSAEVEAEAAFQAYLANQISRLEAMISTPYGELDESGQMTIDSILDFLQENEIYFPEEMDAKEAAALDWEEETISLKEFLENGIRQNAIRIPSSQLEGRYYTEEDLMRELNQFILDGLPENENFHHQIYRHLVGIGEISQREICRILFEQGVLSDTGGEYDSLVSGQSDPYEFIRELIRTLRLTPAQLALDPCTASCVVTEPDTGRVLACVTYPGYDNNRLANTIDGDYYEQLLNDRSLPLYNNASQQRTAPGSTFKPITAISALAEGIIDQNTRIEDLGRFELITPSPRCWILALGGSHGEINVQEAIRDSCNYFFYTLGYEMSLENDSYHEEQGIETLQQYTELFGLNETSGIELPENSPQIADSFPVTAAIGQSNHNYTTTQLARYVSVLANKGSLYELTLVGAVEDGTLGGQTVQEPVLTRQLDEISPDLWETIDVGMEMMAADNRTLGELSIPIAGKTGTAQQTAVRPNHALFVGYAPAEEPQIAVAARIAYGYSSSNAVDVAADVVRYYFGLAPEGEILTGTADASSVSGNVTVD